MKNYDSLNAPVAHIVIKDRNYFTDSPEAAMAIIEIQGGCDELRFGNWNDEEIATFKKARWVELDSFDSPRVYKVSI